MYLKEKFVTILRGILALATVFVLIYFANSIFYIGGLFIAYGSDFETIKSAVSYDECIKSIIISPFVLFIFNAINSALKESVFYNSYLEGDLNGFVSYKDLSNITGDSEKKIRWKIIVYRIFFMKNFKINNKKICDQIILNSKKVKCQCLSCGAEIEKSTIFTGNCSYCGSSDLSAKVLTSERFYSLNYKITDKKSKKDYLCRFFGGHLTFWIFVASIFLLFTMILICMIIDYAVHINDHEYLKKILFEGRPGWGSFDLIKKNMRDQMLFNALNSIVSGVIAVISVIKLRSLSYAGICSGKFAASRKPFLTLADIFYESHPANRGKQLKKIKRSVSMAYLKNCSFEKFDETTYITLDRMVVKDRCPGCAAPIKDPVYEEYECKYCGSKIMDVIAKK